MPLSKEMADFLEWHNKVKAEGYLGIMPGTGIMVDRREHPEAIAMQENSLFNIPAPKEVKPKSE
jgi:hypothetical protein